MDNFDKKIEEILKSDIKKPIKYEAAIRNALKNEKVKSKINIRYKVCIPICCLLVISTIVIANSSYIREKIWKEPKKMTIEDIKENLDNRTESNKENEVVSKEVIIEKVMKYCTILGNNNVNIEEIELQTYALGKLYNIKISGDSNLIITINAENGELNSITNFEKDYKNTENIADKKAEEYAYKFCNDLGINIIGYEIKYCNEDDFYFENQVNKQWVIKFNKMYNECYNPYESVKLILVQKEGKALLKSLMIEKDNTFSNNQITITQKQAEEIATKKENELSTIEINKIESELSIRKMNTYIYRLEKGTENNRDSTIDYVTENMTRNVWVVRIKHVDMMSSNFESDLEYEREMDKKYFIDATTGEIIGGDRFFEESNNLLYS